MKKSLFTGLAALAISLTSCTHKSNIEIKQGYARTVKASWDEGIAQISEHAKSNPFEDNWLYFPNKGEWIDVGEYSHIHRHENKTKIVSNRNDERTAHYMSLNWGPAIAVHVHPDSHLKEDYPNPKPYRQKDFNYKQKIGSITSRKLREVYGEYKVTKPGIADLRTMHNHSRLHQDIKGFAVVSSKGISFYKPNRTFSERIENERIYNALEHFTIKGNEKEFEIANSQLQINFSTNHYSVPKYLQEYLR